MAVTALGCAGLHPGLGGSHGTDGANHSLVPFARKIAVSPPPTFGSKSRSRKSERSVAFRVTRATSETAAKAVCPSLAMPHSTPPFVPPLPTRNCHNTSPWWSGSSPYTTPDFCPATSTVFAPDFTSMGEEPKSKSGPQLEVGVHEPLKISPGVSCRDHLISPVCRLSATIESLNSLTGRL